MVDHDDAAGSGAFTSVGPVEAPRESVVIAPAAPADRRGFRAGVVLGMTWTAILVHGFLIIAIDRLRTYVPEVPSYSRVAQAAGTAGWRWGSLIGLVALAAGSYALVGRGKRWPLAVTAGVTAVVVGIMTYAVSYRVNEITGGWLLYGPDR